MGQKTASILAVVLVGLIIGSSAYYVLMKAPSTDPSDDCKEGETLVDGNCVAALTGADEPPIPVEIECGVLEVKANGCRPLMPLRHLITASLLLKDYRRTRPSVPRLMMDRRMDGITFASTRTCFEQRHRGNQRHSLGAQAQHRLC